jgi:hypothetical protein
MSDVYVYFCCCCCFTSCIVSDSNIGYLSYSSYIALLDYWKGLQRQTTSSYLKVNLFHFLHYQNSDIIKIIREKALGRFPLIPQAKFVLYNWDGLTRPYNTGYAVKYHLLARILAL